MLQKSSKPQISNLMLRIVSASVLIPIVIGATWIGDPLYSLVVALFMSGCIWEWLRIKQEAWPRAIVMTVWMFVVLAIAPLNIKASIVGVLICFFFALVRLLAQRIAQRTYVSVYPSFFSIFSGFIVIYGAGLGLILLRATENTGFSLTIILFTIVWATDIGAYAAGRLIGGAKLAPTISPNKTWAGSIGGLVAAVAFGTWLSYLLDIIPMIPDPRADCPIMGACKMFDIGALGLFVGTFSLLSIISQLGDLAESAIKRSAGIKDSGNLIPGHDGVLDRLDGLIAASFTVSMLFLIGTFGFLAVTALVMIILAIVLAVLRSKPR